MAGRGDPKTADAATSGASSNNSFARSIAIALRSSKIGKKEDLKDFYRRVYWSRYLGIYF